jgi:hypothetical protein
VASLSVTRGSGRALRYKSGHAQCQHTSGFPLQSLAEAHRINMKHLIDLGILASVEDAPRGFKPISRDYLNLILKETKSDESFIVD